MHDTLVGRVSRSLLTRGVTNGSLLAVALVTAWFEDRSTSDPKELFRSMAQRIGAEANGSALTVASDWLAGPGLSAFQWDALAEALRDLQRGPAGPVDWSAELTTCLAHTRSGLHLGPNLPIARALNRVLDLPLSDSCLCIFDGAATLAWSLSSDRDVTLLLGNHDAAIVVALFARAAARPLDTRYLPNLVDALSLSVHLGGAETPALVDHVITVPPFGMRVREGDSRGMPVETFQIERLVHRAKKTFVTIVPDGALFREGRQEANARQSLVDAHTITVMSLPLGTFAPFMGLATSLVRLEPDQSVLLAWMVEARSIERTLPGRPSEQEIVRHLEQFQGMQSRNHDRLAVAVWDDLEANSFNLLPERYMTSAYLGRVEEAMRDLPMAALEDIAVVERSKAPIPIRDGDENAAIFALEVAPSDIVGGIVREPKRRLAFDSSQNAAVAKVAIKPGDILVSIKGNVGIVGYVNIDASLAVLFEEPWIVSQSLAIVRPQDEGPFADAQVLAAALTAPWVREKLESMSGGSTVRTLPISALRSLAIPLPSTELIAEVSDQLQAIEQLRYNVAQLEKAIDETRSALWHSLWNLTPETGEQ